MERNRVDNNFVFVENYELKALFTMAAILRYIFFNTGSKGARVF